MIAAGQLREEITIEQKTVASRDAVGGEVITWAEHAKVRAAALPISGREFVALQAAQAQISIRFRLRYVSGVTPDMRVSWKGDRYGIVEAIDLGARGKVLELLCSGAAT